MELFLQDVKPTLEFFRFKTTRTSTIFKHLHRRLGLFESSIDPPIELGDEVIDPSNPFVQLILDALDLRRFSENQIKTVPLNLPYLPGRELEEGPSTSGQPNTTSPG